MICFLLLLLGWQALNGQVATEAGLAISFDNGRYTVSMTVESTGSNFPFTLLSAAQISIITPASNGNNTPISGIQNISGGSWSITSGSVTDLGSSKLTALATTGGNVEVANIGPVPLFSFTLVGATCDEQVVILANNSPGLPTGQNFNNNLDVFNIDGSNPDIYNGNNSNSVACSVFPVEFTTFTAEALRDETALLKWGTATELNNDYFQIEHSTDGVNFAKIGLQKGAGTSFEAQSYNFVHPNPRAGINYYRLRQVDLDGTFDYSEIRSVNFAKGGSFQIFPNPSTDYVQIVPPSADTEVDWNVDVYDIQGRLVQKFNLTDINFRLSTANWPSGVYHLQLRSGQRVEQLRFVKE